MLPPDIEPHRTEQLVVQGTPPEALGLGKPDRAQGATSFVDCVEPIDAPSGNRTGCVPGRRQGGCVDPGSRIEAAVRVAQRDGVGERIRCAGRGWSLAPSQHRECALAGLKKKLGLELETELGRPQCDVLDDRPLLRQRQHAAMRRCDPGCEIGRQQVALTAFDQKAQVVPFLRGRRHQTRREDVAQRCLDGSHRAIKRRRAMAIRTCCSGLLLPPGRQEMRRSLINRRPARRLASTSGAAWGLTVARCLGRRAVRFQCRAAARGFLSKLPMQHSGPSAGSC